MAKKTHIKVRLVPEAKPNSSFYYYVKKPAGGEKAKVKLKVKKYNPATRKHEIFIEKKSFYKIFINPEIKDIIINPDSESIIPDIESVPEIGDLE